MITLSIPSHVKALIFDCDGTLADTMPAHIKAWAKVFVDRGREFPDAFWARFYGVPSDVILTQYNDTFGDNLDIEEAANAKQAMVYEMLTDTRPIRPVAELAHRHFGDLPMSVVSGGTRANVLHTLEAIGMTHMFTPVLTADDPIAPKPSPDLFLRAAEVMGVAPKECHVFEDGPAGMDGAVAAGMTFTDVRPVISSTQS